MRLLTALSVFAAMSLLSGATAFADHDRGRDRAEVRDNDGVRDNDDNRGAIVVRDDDAVLHVLNQRVAILDDRDVADDDHDMDVDVDGLRVISIATLVQGLTPAEAAAVTSAVHARTQVLQ